MSKHDSHFANYFSLVLGILIAIAILLFALAKVVGSTTQGLQVKAEALQLASVNERTRPFARVAVAGEDNTALAIVEKAAATTESAPGLPIPQTAEELYNSACSTCHAQGIGGAPRLGDKAAWAPRIAQGGDTLHKHAVEGFQGQTGLMPPKGGRVDLPDDLIRQGVDYMVEHSR
ncbi:MAG TPA: c-type cytochrome [Steroidobacteraceae bacterium]|nr:c-type cytochrome [Steroidobacteraceae bacterium]